MPLKPSIEVLPETEYKETADNLSEVRQQVLEKIENSLITWFIIYDWRLRQKF